MKRFILLSFAFLAFAFYELSGGSEFEPASVRMASLAPTPEKAPDVQVAEIKPTTPNVAQVEEVAVAKVDVISETRVALNLTTRTDTNLSDFSVSRESETVPENVSLVTLGDVTASIDTPAIIPSLIAPGESEAPVEEVDLADPVLDIREVSGSRVNVRGGPGTGFSVVNKLVRGDAVEVLEDNGEGWVRMRPVDGGPEGWMADFLLTSG